MQISTQCDTVDTTGITRLVAVGAGFDFWPIGNKWTSGYGNDFASRSNFTGTSDGRYHTISNLTYDEDSFAAITGTGNDNGFGLFYSVTGAVSNLTLSNVVSISL